MLASADRVGGIVAIVVGLEGYSPLWRTRRRCEVPSVPFDVVKNEAAASESPIGAASMKNALVGNRWSRSPPWETSSFGFGCRWRLVHAIVEGLKVSSKCDVSVLHKLCNFVAINIMTHLCQAGPASRCGTKSVLDRAYDCE